MDADRRRRVSTGRHGEIGGQIQNAGRGRPVRITDPESLDGLQDAVCAKIQRIIGKSAEDHAVNVQLLGGNEDGSARDNAGLGSKVQFHLFLGTPGFAGFFGPLHFLDEFLDSTLHMRIFFRNSARGIKSRHVILNETASRRNIYALRGDHSFLPDGASGIHVYAAPLIEEVSVKPDFRCWIG